MLRLYKKKNILITGATGFLGKSIIKKIDKTKYNITLVTRRKIPGYNQIIVKDFFKVKKKQYVEILKDQAIVLHLAWYAKPRKYFNSKQNYKCLKGSKLFALACKQASIKKFICIGSCSEYKPSNSIHKPNDKLLPSNIYSKTKINLFRFCSRVFKNNDTKFLWLRIFYIYGEGEPENKLVSYVLSKIKRNKKAILSNGNQIKDFIHINRAVDQIIKVIEKKKYEGAINICSGKGLTVKDFITGIAKKIKKEKYLIFGKKKMSPGDYNHTVGEKNVK